MDFQFTPLSELARSAGQVEQADLMEKAALWNGERVIRACEQLRAYRLLPTGALVSRETGEVYECEDVRQWPELPGAVVFIGCNCPDEEQRLRPLRAQLGRAGCGAPCHCKHHYLRLLLSGHSIRVHCDPAAPLSAPGWRTVRALPAVLK
ncbi:MAG: hypothetical protein H0U25_06220 [Thermoleophilaceae bacterium]|nr:hypothetical protein [Thermoleophilaceae bacterium]